MRSADLLMSVNQNVPSCAASGANNGCRPNPNYANNSQYSSVGDSNYHGLHLAFVQRPTTWGSYRVSYTLSKSMNNVGENFFSSPPAQYELRVRKLSDQSAGELQQITAVADPRTFQFALRVRF